MLAGFDIGTGSLKAVLGTGNGLLTVTETYPAEMVNNGIQDFRLLKSATGRFLAKLAGKAAETGEDIEGIGLCGQGPSILIIDNEGNPGTDIVTWQNGDAAEEAVELSSRFEGFDKDGTSFEAKLLRIQRRNPELLKPGNRALYPKDYLLFLLTGRICLDFSTASTLVFFDQERRCFNTGETGIPENVFSRDHRSMGSCGCYRN